MVDDYDNQEQDDLALTLVEMEEINSQIEDQPKWRAIADKEMDYADGNQLDMTLLKRMAEIGVPPAVEDRIGPALRSIQGLEVQRRTDFRVTANGEPESKDVADALNYKLNQAEKFSKADEACTKAFRAQSACGLGWVEVRRESNPMKFPYRCQSINRNEIFWDMSGTETDLSDAEWLVRVKWVKPRQLALSFPRHAEEIKSLGRGDRFFHDYAVGDKGGTATGLTDGWTEDRGPARQEAFWYNPSNKELCVREYWYKRWVRAQILRTKNGRVVEFDPLNESHQLALATGYGSLKDAVVSKMRRAYWVGRYQLFDGPTPYSHDYFPYVPFFGFIEDNRMVPYGYVRGMKYSQDALNSGLSKLRYGMSVTRVIRTKGAVDMDDDTLRRQVARPDSDIILNSTHMAKQGARFEITRDFQLTDQQFRLLDDSRVAIQDVSNITDAFQGKTNNAQSGYQEETRKEQTNQALNRIMDNFDNARIMIGEMLISMIVDDIGDNMEVVVIEGDPIKPTRTVFVNKPETDDEGYPYLSNDLQRTRLLVALEEVPTTSSFRGQQLMALSEVLKSMPPESQQKMVPFMTALMDIPYKEEIVSALNESGQAITEEEVQQRIQEAVAQAMLDKMTAQKDRELDLKEKRMDVELEEIVARAVESGVRSSLVAMQTATQVVQLPQAATIADSVLKSAGFIDKHNGGLSAEDVVVSDAQSENQAPPVTQDVGMVPNEEMPMGPSV